MILASLSLSTFGVGVWAGTMHTLVNDAYPKRIVATVHGLAGSAGAVAGIVFNTFTGYLSAQGAYWAVFLMWSLLQPLGVAGLWLWLKDEPEKPAGDPLN